MTDFGIYVIESNGEYYYSLKGQDFRSAKEATIFRNEKSAEKIIHDAIRSYRNSIVNLSDRYPERKAAAEALLTRWVTTAKIVKIA